MNSALDIISVILFVGAAQGILLAVFLFTHRSGNRIANRFLGSKLLLFSLIILAHTFGQYETHAQHKQGVDHQLVHSLIFLFGPLIYFYVKILTRPLFKFGGKDWLHFSPFVVSILAIVIYQVFSLQEYSLMRESYHVIGLLTIWAIIILYSVYLYFSIVLLRRHAAKIKDSFSSIEKINLNWLRFLISSHFIIWPVALYIEFMGNSDALWNIVWLLVSIFIYLVGYLGLRQPVIFSGETIPALESSDIARGKYAKSALTAELSESYFNKLQQVMDKEKLFLDPNLTLPFLAKKLLVSVHHLSQVINEKMDQNFFEFVNNYRVEEAKQLLLDPGRKHLNISAIGFEAGFNSNSSFNSVFKKLTGMTPSQFRNSA